MCPDAPICNCTQPCRLFFYDFCDASTCRENVSGRLESKLGAHRIHNICKFNWAVQCKLFNGYYTESIQEFTCDFHAEKIFPIQSWNSSQRIRNFCNHPISPVETQIKTQVSSRCSSIVKFKEEMGTSISSMEARIPRCQLTCPFKLVWISAISRPFMVDNFKNIDRKHRSIILIENIDRLNAWARLGGLFAVWICCENFSMNIFGLNLWCIFRQMFFDQKMFDKRSAVLMCLVY